MGNRNSTLPVADAVPRSITTGEAFLATNYEPDISKPYGQLVTVHIAISDFASSVITYTINGNSYHSFLNGEALTGGAGMERQILLRFDDKLNFKSESDIVLSYCRVDLV